MTSLITINFNCDLTWMTLMGNIVGQGASIDMGWLWQFSNSISNDLGGGAIYEGMFLEVMTVLWPSIVVSHRIVRNVGDVAKIAQRNVGHLASLKFIAYELRGFLK